MSLVVFAIAAIPAAVVVVVAAVTRSRTKTSIAAVLAALVGALTGNPVYMAIDLGFVALAVFFAWPQPDLAASKAGAEARVAAIEAKSEARAARRAYLDSDEFKVKRIQRHSWMVVLAVAAIGMCLLYLRFALTS
jgi:hypothetical protein